MATIVIKCCDCKKEIKVNIKTIDKLRTENNELRKKVKTLRARCAALEVMRESCTEEGWLAFQEMVKNFDI